MTTVVSAYREEVQLLTKWCAENNLGLNIINTKELIVDYWKPKGCRRTLYSHLRYNMAQSSHSCVSISVMISFGLSKHPALFKRHNNTCTF